MELVVKAKHFEGTRFEHSCNCAIAKAAKDQFKTRHVEENIDEIKIDEDRFKHEWYLSQFDDDQAKAASLNYSDEVIRTIELTPIN